MIVCPYIAPPANPLLNGSESDGTNLITTGDIITGTNWSNDGASWVTGFLAPNGSPTAASLLKEDTTLNRHIGYQQPGTFDYSINRTMSVYAKYAGRHFQLEASNVAGTNRVVSYYDLINGVATATAVTGSGVAVSASCLPAVNGFFKCIFVMNLATASDTSYFQLDLSDRLTDTGVQVFKSPSYTGDNASGCYLWRPKLT